MLPCSRNRQTLAAAIFLSAKNSRFSATRRRQTNRPPSRDSFKKPFPRRVFLLYIAPCES
jgi:hypothetical protein